MTIHDRRGLLGPLAGARLERKDAGDTGPTSAELARQITALGTAWAEFKAKNDENIGEIQKKKIDDVVLREEIDRINKAIDEALKKRDDEILELKRQRIIKDAADEFGNGPALTEYKEKLIEYMRKGPDFVPPRELVQYQAKAAAETASLGTKALSVSTESDGGFTVIPQWDQTIREAQVLISPIRQIAQVVTTGNNSYKVIADMNNAGTGWVGELDARSATSTSLLKETEVFVNEAYAFPQTTQTLLDDSFVNIEQWLASNTSTQLARLEGVAFVSGDGVKKPFGILSTAYGKVSEAVTAYSASTNWGSLGYRFSGAASGFPTTTQTVQGADIFFDIIGDLRYLYRQNARWVLNRRTVAAIRKFKTYYSDYLWAPGLQSGQPDSIAGYPLVEAEDMPDIAAGAFPIAFGDFQRGYIIVDRIGLRVLRDNLTNKPYVGFYTTKRVGGAIQMFEAIKLLKIATS
jgi:hypothetical protein